jgi:DNA-binding transcriptional LysR family regulator
MQEWSMPRTVAAGPAKKNGPRGDTSFPVRRESMLDNLQELRIFSRVVGSGSMSAAARELDLSLAVVSKRVAALEERLGLRLLHRTTRRQSLTPEGESFHERCLRILAEVQDAESSISDQQDGVGGLLSVTATPAFGRQYLAPLVAQFQAQHPAVSVRLLLTDDVVDLVEHRIGLAFRFGVLADSGLKARRLAPNFRVLCAAPAYLQRHGAPQRPDDLARHACIVWSDHLEDRWRFERRGQAVEVRVKGRFGINDGEVAQALALEGAGLIYKSVWEIGTHLEAGRLVPVMMDYAAPSKPLHVVFPQGRLPARDRAFIDLARQRLPAIGPRLALQAGGAAARPRDRAG